MSRRNLHRVLSFLGVLLIASSFVSLGIWQLNRARELRIPVVVDKEIVPLQSVTAASIALPPKAALRNVQLSGTYIADFQAPYQADAAGHVATWEVGLFATQPDAAILVVRGLWAQRDLDPIAPGEKVTVTGRLMPHQNDDLVQSSPTVLSRIDSALVVDRTSLNLYDGYVIAKSEITSHHTQVERSRILPPVPRSGVPGFYWQHLSYVLIWWFMAGVVLYLPLYQRRVGTREPQED